MMDGLKSLPNTDSAELKAAIDTQSTVNWWAKSGMKFFTDNLALLREEFRKSVETYNKETGSNVPVPDKLPPVSTTPMPDFDMRSPHGRAEAADWEYLRAEKGGDTKEIAAAYDATMKATHESYDFTDRQRGAYGLASKALNNYFGFGKADSTAQNKLDTMIRESVYSNDPEQTRLAEEFAKISDQIPKNIRKDMDKKNTLNSFADTNNLEQVLRELINVTRDLGITVNVP